MSDLCITCGTPVRPRQEALQCETCLQWNHRKCGTGISRQLYRRLVKGDTDLDWYCDGCGMPEGMVPDHESDSEPTPQLDPPSNLEPAPAQDVSMTDSEPTPQLDPPSNLEPAPAQDVSMTDSEPTPQLDPPSNMEPAPAQDVSMTDSEPTPQLDPPSNMEPALQMTPPSQPEILLEESIEDPSITENDMMSEDLEPQFSITENASQRGGPLLTDNRGFSFSLRRKYKDTTYWWCTVRSKNLHCHATVVQKGEIFTEGKQPHCHPARPGLENSIKITAKVKESAKQNLRDSARTVVEDILKDHINLQAPNPSRPNPDTLIRKANRTRETLRPKEPRDLGFQLNYEFLPGDFLQGDVDIRGERHLVMATPEQLAILVDAKTWYMDGTFKVVRRPFYQLLSIHCFVRSGDATKQVPLAFALMSRRRTRDYTAVLKEIMNQLPRRPAVRKVVLDFEMGMWKACKAVLPEATLSGCAFHWTQAVFRKAQELALQGPYRQRETVHLYVRRLLALVYLPAESIPSIFLRLKAKATTSALEAMVEYVENQWISNCFWTPTMWSVYGQPVRTNNDVEGWHRRLNDKAGECQLGMYKLIPLLYSEAEQVPLQRLLVTEGKLRSLQRKKTRSHQAKLFSLWEQYHLEAISDFQLLKKCAFLTQPID